MIKKTSSNQSCRRDRECKMVHFKVPQYTSNPTYKPTKTVQSPKDHSDQSHHCLYGWKSEVLNARMLKPRLS